MRIKKFLLLVIAICISFIMTGCVKSSWFSEKTHIKRVSKIIEEKYLEEGVTYKLRPLYDNNDELSYFVVEFSDDTFLYIKIWDTNRTRFPSDKFYTKDTTRQRSSSWKRGKYVEENGKRKVEYEKDENGNDVIYYKSHFKEANINEDTKCYLIEVNDLDNHRILIPAIKQGDKYLNLILMEEFDENCIKNIPVYSITFNIKSDFNL